jgi:hypothetical protein
MMLHLEKLPLSYTVMELWKIQGIYVIDLLCICKSFFDSIPQDQWRTSDPTFIKQSEEIAITKFKDWLIEQIT